MKPQRKPLHPGRFVRLFISLATLVSFTAPGNAASSNPAQSKPRPNFLIIVADDLGYSDIGAFGGEIKTPNLDALAHKGVRFTSFYTAPTCSPTRSMLLTGKDAHQVGLGTMNEMLRMMPGLSDQPGYEGHLDLRATTVAEALGAAGYRTMMSGKWHLGLQPEWQPQAHGFQQSFVLLQGAGDHFGADQDGNWRSSGAGATYAEDGKPARLPAGAYTGDYFTERMIGYLKHEADDHRPFFAYLAFNEPHWPLQAAPALIAKYKGRYNAGPQALREQRFARMKALGLLKGAELESRPGNITDWNSLSAEQRAVAARAMEIYAAMVDSLDQNVGRVLTALKKSGDLDNTVIVFMSDNGAEGVSQQQMNGLLKMFGLPGEDIQKLNAANTDLSRMGSVGSYVVYGPDWAQAAMGPFRLFKGLTNEGAIRSPAFVSGPGIAGKRIFDGALSVRDVMPTLLDLAGVNSTVNSAVNTGANNTGANDRHLPNGRSWAPMLAGQSNQVRSADDMVATELFFRRGIRRGNWKAVFSTSDAHLLLIGQQSSEQPRWRLYNLHTDPGELHDLADRQPVVLNELIQGWNAYAAANGVVTLPLRPVMTSIQK